MTTTASERSPYDRAPKRRRCRSSGSRSKRGLALGADGYEVNPGYDVLRETGCGVDPRLERGGGGDERARDPAIGMHRGCLHPAYPGRQLQDRRPERPAAGRMVRIVGNRGAALQQLQTKIENRALTCIENVVPLASQSSMFGNGSAVGMTLRVGGPCLADLLGSTMARERSAAAYCEVMPRGRSGQGRRWRRS